MAARHLAHQGISLLGMAGPAQAVPVLHQGLFRLFSGSASLRWPDVLVPSMGESIKEGTIATVLKKAGESVREDEVIAQIETDKVTIDVKTPVAGVLHSVLVKPADLVVAGQVVAVVGEGAAAAGAAPKPAAAGASGAAAVAAESTSGRTPSIKFPPRVTPAGARISGLPEEEYAAALAAATAASASTPAAAAPAPAAPVPAPAAAPTVAAVPAAAAYPPSALRAGAMSASKNKLTYVTRPDGRGGPPRRELTERELEIINLGGAS